MSQKKVHHIAISGNIGAGKTSLAEMLGKHYGWKVQYEDVEHNPYLADFYADMTRWSFNLQIYFLHSRYLQVLETRKNDVTTIQDRTIYEDAKIFAPNLRDMGVLNMRDFNNYEALFNTMISQVNPPDVLIYLRASIEKLVSQIAKRGRAYEDGIKVDYLKKLNKYYNDWIDTYDLGPLLVIDVDDIDFVSKKEDFEAIINQINEKLNKTA